MMYRRLGMRIPPHPDADANNGQGTSVLFPIAAISPLTLAAAALLRTGASHNGSNARPKSLRRTSLMTLDPPRPAYLLFTSPQPGRRQPSTILLYGVTSHSGGFRTFKPLEKPHLHPRPGASASNDSDRIECPTHPQG